MVIFLFFTLVGIVGCKILSEMVGGGRETGSLTLIKCSLALTLIIGLLVGLNASLFLGGIFVKKEIVLEKYNIFPMIVEGKNVAAIDIGGNQYLLSVKKEGHPLLIKKEIFFEKNLFFSEERYLEIKKRKACNEKMWLLFFYGDTGFIEAKVVLQKGDIIVMRCIKFS